MKNFLFFSIVVVAVATGINAYAGNIPSAQICFSTTYNGAIYNCDSGSILTATIQIQYLPPGTSISIKHPSYTIIKNDGQVSFNGTNYNLTTGSAPLSNAIDDETSDPWVFTITNTSSNNINENNNCTVILHFVFPLCNLTSGNSGSSAKPIYFSAEIDSSNNLMAYLDICPANQINNNAVYFDAIKPDIKLVPFSAGNCPVAIGSTTASSENNVLKLKFQTFSRYYLLQANSGILDFFTFDVAPANNLLITSIEAVRPDNLQNALPGALYTLSGQVNPGIIHLVFNDSIIKQYHQGGNNFLYASVDSNSFILIKEDIKVVNCSDDIIDTPSQYILKIYCDGKDGSSQIPDPFCVEEENTLNIVCHDVAAPIYLENVHLSNQISMCSTLPDSNTTTLTLTYANTSTNVAGTYELSTIQIPLNELYFTLDSSYGIRLDGNPVIYHIDNPNSVNMGFPTDKFIVINASDFTNATGYTNPADGTQLDKSFNDSSGNVLYIDSVYPGSYQFLPPGASFQISFKVSFNCVASMVDAFGDSISLKDGLQYFSFSEFDIQAGPFYVTTRDMCGMGWHLANGLPAYDNGINMSDISNEWITRNRYGGTVNANVTPTDVGAGLSTVGHITFAFYPNANYDALALNLASSYPTSFTSGTSNIRITNLFNCNPVYYIALQMDEPQYSLDINNITGNYKVTIVNNTVGTQYDIPPSQIIYKHNGLYYIIYSNINSFSPGDEITLSFNAILDLSKCDGPGNSTFGVNNFTTDFRVACNMSCITDNSSCYRTLAGGVVSLNRHCIQICASYPKTSNFTMERSTFGWSDYNNYISGGSPITYDSVKEGVLNGTIPPGKYPMDIVYQCDHVHCVSSNGSINPYPSDNYRLCFDIYYDLPSDFNNENIFEFLDGKVHFKSSSDSFDIAIDPTTDISYNTPNPYSPPENTYTLLRIKIPEDSSHKIYSNHILRTIPYNLTFTCDLKINIPGNLTLKNPNYSIPNVRSQFRLFDTTDILKNVDSSSIMLTSCDPYGTELKISNLLCSSQAYIINDADYSMGDISLPDEYENDCMLRYFLYTNVSGGFGGDDFPNEFRPFIKWPSLMKFQYTYPAFPGQYSFVKAQYMNQDDLSVWYDLDSTLYNITKTDSGVTVQDKNTIHGPLLPTEDQKYYSNYQAFMLTFHRTCMDGPQTPDGVRFLVNDFVDTLREYASDNDCKVPIGYGYNNGNTIAGASLSYGSVLINTDSSDIQLNIPSKPVTAYTPTTYIPVDIYENTGGISLPNVWLYFTSSNQNIAKDIDISIDSVQYTDCGSLPLVTPIQGPVNGLYRIPQLPYFNINAYNCGHINFKLKVKLDCQNTIGNSDSLDFYITAHYGYACVNADYNSLQLTTSNGEYSQSPGWNSCSNQNKKIYIQFQSPSLNVTPVGNGYHFQTSSQSSCGNNANCEFTYVDVSVNSLNSVQASNLYFYAIPAGSFQYCPDASYVEYTLVGNNTTYYNLNPGVPEMMQIPSSTNFSSQPFAFAWNIDSILKPPSSTVPYLFEEPSQSNPTTVESVIFHLAFKPDCALENKNYGFNFLAACQNACGDYVTSGDLYRIDVPYSDSSFAGCCENTPFTIIIDSVTSGCFAGCNGAFTVSVDTIKTNYNMNISYPGGSIIGRLTNGSPYRIKDLCAGTYTILVYGSNGYVSSRDVEIVPINKTNPSISFNTINPVCSSNNGAINALITNGTLPYSYSWNTNSSTQNIAGLAAGVYSLTVNDANQCSTSKDTTLINITTTPVLTTTSTDASCGNNGGSINIAVSGGTPGFIYQWSNNATTQNIAVLTASIYSITVTDANNCSATTSATINNQPSLNVISNHHDATCGNSNGTISLIVNNGIAPFTFVWSDGETTQNISALKEGTYNATVTDTKGCTVTLSVVIAQDTLPAIIAKATNITCGRINGSILLTISAGDSDLTYSWSNGANTQNINNINTDGLYSVTISDTNSCSTTISAMIEREEAPVVHANVTNANCGKANGGITLEIFGGTPGFTYNWSNGMTTVDISNLTGGNYSVVVADTNGCRSFANAIVFQSPQLNVTSWSAEAKCGGIAGLIVNGAMPFSYNWSNNDTTSTIGNLQSGTYTVTVTDQFGCSISDSIVVHDSLALITTIIPIDASCGNNNGSINITVTGGTPGFTYNWSNNDISQTISSLGAGTYVVTVTDSIGCSAIGNGTIKSSSNSFATSISGDTIICSGSNTVLTANDGAIYKWSNGSTEDHISINTGGDYTVTVVDTSGCSDSSSIEVNVNPMPVISIQPTSVCSGMSTTLEASGASVYTWSPSTGLSATNMANPIDSITSSIIYTITGMSNSCIDTSVVTITVNPLPIISVEPTSVCSGVNIPITASGASSYTWSPGIGLSATNISQPIVNISNNTTYTVTGVSNGCVDSSIIVISVNTDTLNITLGNDTAICDGNTLTLNAVKNNTGAYSYKWALNDTIINKADSSFYKTISAGTYSVTVTDNCGNTFSSGIAVDVISPPSVTAIVTNATCGNSNGNIELTSSNNALTYSWNNGSVGIDRANLIAGAYSVTITNTTGCTTVDSIVVANISGPSINETHVYATCGNNNGSISLTITGGTIPFRYNWSDGETSQDISNLSANAYTIVATDSNGCSATDSVIINNLGGPSINETHVIATCNSNNGSISLTITGGVPAYIYNWSDGETSQDISNLSPNTYAVTVTDSNNCYATKFINITDIPAPVLSGTVNNTTCNYNNGNINLTVKYGSSPYSYLWSNSASTQNLSNVASNSYSVTVTDSTNCTVTSFYDISGSSGIILSPLSDTIICGHANGIITLNVAGGTVPYSYSWNNGATTRNIQNLTAGNYLVTVTDLDGCTSNEEIPITCIPPGPCLLSINADVNNTSCFDTCNGMIKLSVLNYSKPVNILWNTGDTVSNISDLCAGNYSVIVTDYNGCSDSLSVNINQPRLLEANTSVMNVLCNGSSTGAIDLTTQGGTPPYRYVWNNNNSTPDLSNLHASLYSVTVTDGNNCTATISQQVTQPNPLIITLNHTDENCNQSNGTAQIILTGGMPPYYYLWSTDDTTKNISGLKAGNYHITVKDSNQCIITDSLTVKEIPRDTIRLSSISNTICVGQIITVSASGSQNYFWNPVDGLNTSTGNAVTITAQESINYIVIATDQNGCKDTASYSLFVYPTATAKFSVDSTSGCPPLTISFVNNSTNAVSYQWRFGDFQSSTSSNPVITIDTPGNYDVSLIAYSPYGCNDTSTLKNMIHVYPEPLAAFSSTPEAGTMILLKNATINFNNQSNGAKNFLWNFGDGFIDSTTNPTHQYTSDSIFNVTLLVTNEYSCRDSTQKQEIVVSEGNIFIPNIITPNGDGKNDYFKVYGQGIKWCHMQVFDRWGALVFESSSTDPEWDGTKLGKPLDSGVFVYLVELNLDSGSKIIKYGDVTLLR